MQAIGLCRFSYPALGGFQVEHDTVAERCAYLYAPARMEERFRLFEHVALPCMVAQTDPRWEIIIVIGDNMPPAYESRLRDLVAPIPQISIQAHPPRPQREIMKEVFNTARTDPSKPCLQFRYDDDDAVAVDFIAKFREAAKDGAALNAKYQGVAYDWHKGFAASFSADGIAAKEVFTRNYVAALGLHVRGGSKLTIMNFAHHRIDRYVPVISFGDRPMWVEGYNAFNDSNMRGNKRADFSPLDPDQVALFQDRFAINADAVRAAFAGSTDVPAKG